MTHFHLRSVPRAATLEVLADEWFDPGAAQGDLRVLIEANDGGASTVTGAIQVGFQIGKSIPRYWYYVGQVAYRSDEPMLARKDRVLLLGNDFTGAHELYGVRVAKPDDQALLDALLIGTLALIPSGADVPGQAAPVVLEIPGSGHAERAPFWAGIGRHLYPHPFPELTRNAHLEWESHLAALLPRQPLVVSLLEKDTQMAIGAPAEDAIYLRDAAVRCGFRKSRQVRICDGGPVFEAPTALFRFAAGTAIETSACIEQGQRCVIRTEDRRDAWIVEAERVTGGIAVAPASATIRDSLRDGAWAYSFY